LPNFLLASSKNLLIPAADNVIQKLGLLATLLKNLIGIGIDKLDFLEDKRGENHGIG
jgi:hypothetical protein